MILHDRYENVKIIIILCKMNVYCVEEPYQRVVLTHQLLKERFEFRLTNLGTELKAQDDNVLSDKYLAFYSVLKSLCHKQRMIETYNFIKLRLSFGKASVLRGVNSTVTTASGGSNSTMSLDKKAKEIAFKLTHNTITYFLDNNFIAQLSPFFPNTHARCFYRLRQTSVFYKYVSYH